MAVQDPKISKKTRKSKIASTQNPSNVKSKEIIGDSDDSDDVDDQPALSVPQKKPQKRVSFDPSLTKDKPSPKPALPSKGTRIVKNSSSEKTDPPSSSSEPETGSSEDEGEKESDASASGGSASDLDALPSRPKSPAKTAVKTNAQGTPATNRPYNVKPVNGVKRKAGDQSSSDESGTEESEEGEEEEQDNEDESETGDEEDEEEEEGDSEGSSSPEKSPVTKATKSKPGAPASESQSHVNRYDPPPGFEKAHVAPPSPSKIADLFRPSDLEGKQIWHITAPAQVPITSVKEVSATSLKDGSAIFSYNGSDYGLFAQSEKPEEALLLPATHENNYQTSKTPISRVLHIRRLVQLPNDVSRPGAAQESDLPRHKQPPGLRMRFQPFGLSSDSDSEGTPNDEQLRSSPQYQRPIALERPSPTKKKKQKTDVQGQKAEPSLAKVKKPKSKPKPTAETVNNMDGSHETNAEAPAIKKKNVEASTKPERNKSKKSSTKTETTPAKEIDIPIDPALPKSATTTATTSTPSSSAQKQSNESQPTTESTPDQRAKRKEEKRRQKALLQKDPQPSSSSIVETAPASTSSTKREPTTAPDISLAEYSARLSSAEEGGGAERKQKQQQQDSPRKETLDANAEKAKRKAKKKLERAKLAADDDDDA